MATIVILKDTQRIIDSGVKPEIRVCYDIANGDVYVELMNEEPRIQY